MERARMVVCDSVALSLCCCFTGLSASWGGEQRRVAPPGGGGAVQGLARGAGGGGGARQVGVDLLFGSPAAHTLETCPLAGTHR